MHSLFIKKLFKLALAFVLTGGVLLPTHKSFAQDTASSTAGIDTRGALGTILMSGLVGGIIGLSTLSFYDKPEKHIRNITWGAGIGMITAALYLTVDVAQTAAKGPPRASLYLFPDEEFKAANIGFVKKF